MLFNLLAGAALFLTSSCHTPVTQDIPVTQDVPAGAIRVVGTVHYFEVEAGFWAVRGDDGVTYDPVDGLPAAFRREGLRVAMVARLRPDLVGTHQVGPLVEIIRIEAV
jgi:hypothetical protein